jgi:hypothetical protein
VTILSARKKVVHHCEAMDYIQNLEVFNCIFFCIWFFHKKGFSQKVINLNSGHCEKKHAFINPKNGSEIVDF